VVANLYLGVWASGKPEGAFGTHLEVPDGRDPAGEQSRMKEHRNVAPDVRYVSQFRTMLIIA